MSISSHYNRLQQAVASIEQKIKSGQQLDNKERKDINNLFATLQKDPKVNQKQLLQIRDTYRDLLGQTQTTAQGDFSISTPKAQPALTQMRLIGDMAPIQEADQYLTALANPKTIFNLNAKNASDDPLVLNAIMKNDKAQKWLKDQLLKGEVASLPPSAIFAIKDIRQSLAWVHLQHRTCHLLAPETASSAYGRDENIRLVKKLQSMCGLPETGLLGKEEVNALLNTPQKLKAMQDVYGKVFREGMQKGHTFLVEYHKSLPELFANLEKDIAKMRGNVEAIKKDIIRLQPGVQFDSLNRPYLLQNGKKNFVLSGEASGAAKFLATTVTKLDEMLALQKTKASMTKRVAEAITQAGKLQKLTSPQVMSLLYQQPYLLTGVETQAAQLSTPTAANNLTISMMRRNIEAHEEMTQAQEAMNWVGILGSFLPYVGPLFMLGSNAQMAQTYFDEKSKASTGIATRASGFHNDTSVEFASEQAAFETLIGMGLISTITFGPPIFRAAKKALSALR